MKFGLITVVTLFSVATLAGPLTNGVYKGHGKWVSNNATGDYQVKTIIDGESVQSTYTLPDGSIKEWTFKIEPNGKFFKVVVNSTNIGQGYCLDKATVCHYELNVGNLRLEETMTFLDGKFYRFGSKEDESGRRFWQEAME